jgi:hypothetical protein
MCCHLQTEACLLPKYCAAFFCDYLLARFRRMAGYIAYCIREEFAEVGLNYIHGREENCIRNYEQKT